MSRPSINILTMYSDQVTLPYRFSSVVLYEVSGYDLLSAIILLQQKSDQNDNAKHID